VSTQTLLLPALDPEEKHQALELLWGTAGYCLRGAEGGELKPGLRFIRRFTRGLLRGAKDIDVSDLSDVELWTGAGFITAALSEVVGERTASKWEAAFFGLMMRRSGMDSLSFHPAFLRGGGDGG